MAATIQQLTHDAFALSDEERAELAQILLRSLEPSSESGVDEAWDLEIARRIDSVRNGTAMGRPAEDVFGNIRKRRQP